MRLRIAGTLIAVGLLALVSHSSHAAPPGTIGFQGALNSSGGAPVSGARTMTFTLYDAATGGTAVWSETKSVNVTGGAFSTSLGDTAPFPVTLHFDQPYWVGVKVGSDAEMTPRLPLRSVPYAMALPGVTPDPSGRYVGIGTASPSTPLDVVASNGYVGVGQFLDQYMTTEGAVGNGAAPGHTISQSFVASLTGNLTRVRLIVQGYDGGPNRNAYTGTISLYNGGAPSGTPIGVYSISNPGNLAWFAFDFSPGFAVTAGQPYTLTVMPTGSNGIYLQGAEGDSYPFGTAFVDNVPQPNGLDYSFQTFVTTTSAYGPKHAITVDRFGNVGIGTSIAYAQLDVMGEARATTNANSAYTAIGTNASGGYVTAADPNGHERASMTVGRPLSGGYAGGVEVGDSDGHYAGALADGTRGYLYGDQLQYSDVLGDKALLYGADSPTHYGLGIQSGLLQMYGDSASSSIGFGYGKSADFHENMRITGSGRVGIGTPNPTSTLDVRGNIKMNSSGNLYASGGPENLYVVRGTVNANGTIALGSGYSVSHPSTGHYTITIPGSTYAQPPTVTVTPWNSAPIVAVVPYILGQSSGATFNTTLYQGTAPVDSAFSFIATGNH